MNTKQQLLLGDLFREALYSSSSVPEFQITFSQKISKSCTLDDDYLIQQLASQLKDSSSIRKEAFIYMNYVTIISDACFNLITKKHPELKFKITQRFKSFISELYKRCDKVSAGKIPEIKDLTALRIILYENETLETLNKCYVLMDELINYFSTLNFIDTFPLNINLSCPDKIVSKSKFSQEEHPTVLLPKHNSLIKKLSPLGKDYISNPKQNGYQAFHASFLGNKKLDNTIRFYTEIQITTIGQLTYKPANHGGYKKPRSEKWDSIFSFDPTKVNIDCYIPEHNIDASGLTKPTYLRERAKDS